MRIARLPNYDRNAKAYHAALKNNYKRMIKYYEWWCGGKEKFLRELCIGYENHGATRILIKNSQELMRNLLFWTDPQQNEKRGRGQPHVWLSAYEYGAITTDGRPRPVYETATINWIPFDFDSEDDIELAYEEAIRVAGNYDGRVIFTGSKGFQVYVATDGDMGRDELKLEQEGIQRVFGLQTSDRAIYGDVARVLRLPYSIHPKTGYQAIPAEIQHTFHDIITKAREVSIP